MEKSHLLGEFLVKNKVITADQLIIAIEEQRSQAHELGLIEQMKDYLTPEEIQQVIVRQYERNETFEEALVDLGFLDRQEIGLLPINEKTHRTPLGQVLLKFKFMTESELDFWLERFEHQVFDDDYEQVKLLKAVPVFANLSDHVLKGIVPLLKYKYYNAGEEIFKEGQPSDYLYLIESGLVRLSVKSGTSEMELDSMQSGYSFGLPGVLSHRPRMERAMAIMNSRIWRMSRDDVHQILVQNPESALVAARLVSDKVQDMLGVVRERKSRVHSGNIHVILVDEEAFDAGMVEKLVQAIGHEGAGDTLLVHSLKNPRWPSAPSNSVKNFDRSERRLIHQSPEGDRLFGVYLPGVEDSYNEGDRIEDLENLSYWLNTEAKKYRAVIFLTYPGHIQFRSMMMGVARRSVIFLRERLPEFVEFTKTNRDRVYLLDSQSPANILKGFSALKKKCPGTLAPNTFKTGPDDLESSCRQIARYMVGSTIGIALGGGGARGMAHVGVLQVLEKEGIQFDAVAGASAGAIIGGGVAMGYSPEKIHELARKHVMFSKPFSDWGIPIRSFARGKRGKRILKKLYGPRFTYETKIPFLPVGCDIATGEAVVMKGTPIWKACLASGAAPGLFPPVEYDDKLLLDGGIVDNVPAAMLDDFGIDVIISVNISVNLREAPFNTRYAFGIILRSIDIMGYHTVTRHLEYTDVNVEPAISKYSVFDWEQGEELIGLGVEAMKKKVPELRYVLKKRRIRI